MPRIRNPKPCLKCGNLTSYKDQICRQCPSFDISNVPVEFLHQFVGLFLGEGSLSIGKNKKAGDTTSLRLGIKLRADDHQVLRLCHFYFGGMFAIYSREGHSPEASWVLKKSIDLQVLLLCIKEICVLPAKKLVDVDIALEWLNWYFSKKFHGFDRTKGLELAQQMREAHRYKD